MAKRPLPEDFKEFIDFLNANNVCYLLVGGWASVTFPFRRLRYIVLTVAGNIKNANIYCVY
jgi:hypothetical protein